MVVIADLVVLYEMLGLNRLGRLLGNVSLT